MKAKEAIQSVWKSQPKFLRVVCEVPVGETTDAYTTVLVRRSEH